jgi:hypothetical protein
MTALTTTSTSPLAAFKPLPMSAVQELFKFLEAQFGKKVHDLFGDSDPEDLKNAWSSGLAGFRLRELQRGQEALRSRRFVPTMGEFVLMCRPALDPEYAWHEAQDGLRARDRGEPGEWSHPAVYRAAIAKSITEAYRIQANGEYATIVVQGWQGKTSGAKPHQTIEQGEILIHSSYGSWGHQWGNMGRPIKQFLSSVSYDYLMGKLLPGELREFDFEASLLSWKKHLVAARRSGQFDRDTLADIWAESCRGETCGVEMFIHRLEQSCPYGMHEDPLWSDLAMHVKCRDNPAAKHFWSELWGEFLAALRKESTAANDHLRLATT